MEITATVKIMFRGIPIAMTAIKPENPMVPVIASSNVTSRRCQTHTLISLLYCTPVRDVISSAGYKWDLKSQKTYSSAILASGFDALADEGINVQMISQGASKVNISMIVNDDEADRTVQILHNAYFS